MPITNFLANEVLDDWLRGNAYSFPDPVYFALGTAAAKDGSFTELTYTGYSRVSHAQGTSSWTSPSGGSSDINLASDLEFGERTDGGATQTPTILGIFDASTSGNLLAYGSISPTKPLDQGDKPYIGDADVSWDQNS
jgi:hypothetical protein